MVSMGSDEALLEALQGGDVRGFDVLYARYERPLFRFIRRHHPAQEDAEDVLHETFLALLRDGPSARRAASLRAWLFQVARNLCLNRHRSRRRATEALAGHASPPALGAPTPHPDHGLEHAQARQGLIAAVAGLPGELAELYQLRASGLSYDEMASVLAIPIGTVKSRMHAMVSRLREEIQRDL
jgi:RNA polymerase sigma-70 factor (ECF subfamily)